MRSRLRWFWQPSAQPLRVLAVVLLVAFLVEGAIMLILPRDLSPGASAAIDAVTLTLALAPSLWFLVVRPLQRLSQERGRLLRNLFNAHEQERSRIARDLHDELGQHLTAVLVHLRSVQVAASLDSARDSAGSAHQAAAAGLEHVRRISRVLRPSVLEDLGLVPAMERLCDDFRQTYRVETVFDCPLDPAVRFRPDVEMCLYRVLQESLTNIARHANATEVVVTLAAHHDTLSLEVFDNGQGFEATHTRGTFGLTGMRERVEGLDGTCDVVSSRGHGTTIRAILPALRVATP